MSARRAIASAVLGVAGLTVAGAILPACSSSRHGAAAATATTAAAPTVPAGSSTVAGGTAPGPTVNVAPTTGAPRHVALPADPCSVLADADVAPVIGAGAVAIVRPRLTSATVSSVSCSWRNQTSDLAVTETSDGAADPFAFRLPALRNPQPVPGLGDQAVESDNLAGPPSGSSAVSVLVRDGDVRVFGTTTVAKVLTATQAALGRL